MFCQHYDKIIKFSYEDILSGEPHFLFYFFATLWRSSLLTMKDLFFLPHIPITKGDVVSIVGSGGKTTLMFHLARELVKKGKRVITTTTTKIFPPHPSESPCFITSKKEEILLRKAREYFQQKNHVTLAEKFIGPKLKGLSPALIDNIQEQGIADVILIEADGAKHCPLKAPNETEPVIPLSTALVLAVVGLDGIGKTNSADNVFRPQYFSRITGIKEGEVITPESVCRVILHPEGLTKGTPESAQIVLILNKGETERDLDAGVEIARFILKAEKKKIVNVLITSLVPAPQVMEIINIM